MPDEKVNGKLVVTDKIGIGIEEPIAQLHIASSTTAPSQTFLESGGALLKLSVDASGAAIGTDNAFPLSIKTDDISRISVSQTGNVTISEALSVQKSLTVSGNVGIGTTSPTARLHIYSADNDALKITNTTLSKTCRMGVDYLGVWIEPSENNSSVRLNANPSLLGLFVRGTDGNVGIGTINPGTKLEIKGHLTLDMGESPILFTGTGSSELNRYLQLINSPALGSASGLKAGGILVSDSYAYANPAKNDLIVKGNVGIGTVNPAYKLDVAGEVHASNFPTSSDARLKTSITPLTNVLEKLEKIHGVSFEWNELYESLGRSTERREIGVTAQDVEAVFPELVTTWGDEGYKAVDYGRLTGVLIEAAKELKAENEALKQRIEALEKVIENK